MRKLSILALVVILAGAVTVVGYAESKDSAEVTFGTSEYISMWVKSGEKVNFGNNLDPQQNHYKVKTNGTTLRIKSNTKWEISHSISVSSGDISQPSEILSLDYGGWIGSEGDFSSDTKYEGGRTTSFGENNDGGQDVDVAYKLHNLENLEEGQYTLTVEFTASTR